MQDGDITISDQSLVDATAEHETKDGDDTEGDQPLVEATDEQTAHEQKHGDSTLCSDDAEQPANYEGKNGTALLAAHLAGACCVKCLQTARGKSGRIVRRHARKIRLVSCEAYDSEQCKLTYIDPAGKEVVVAIPTTDTIPTAWLDGHFGPTYLEPQ